MGVLAGIFIFILVKEDILNLSSATWGSLVFGAVDLDGVDAEILCGQDASLNFGTGAFSAAIWINRRGDNTSGVIPIGKSTDNTGAPGFFVQFVGASGIVRFGTSNAGGTDNQDSTSGIADSDRHLLVITRSASGDKHIYIDGAADEAAPQNSTRNINVAADLSIGSNGGGFFNIDALIDEVSVWNKELTATHVLDCFTAEKKRHFLQVEPGNLKGAWALDDGPVGSSADGVTIKDYSGNGNDGLGDNGGGSLLFAGSLLSYPGEAVLVVSEAGVVVIGNVGALLNGGLIGGGKLQHRLMSC